ncbi:TVP38/TMEM64 family protein [Kitasatospora purpeofusca]|uniref:TVP38/TMEM64 family protein n=1 Tax=Kitasatospora purpeofusca TaxID=67352 RepID=UPI00364808D6
MPAPVTSPPPPGPAPADGPTMAIGSATTDGPAPALGPAREHGPAPVDAAPPDDAPADGPADTPAEGPAPADGPARSPWPRFALLVAILGAAAGSLLLWSPTALLDGGLSHGMPWYWRGPLFAAVYAVGTVAFFPRPALNAAAGLLLGLQEGLLLAVLGTTLGAAAAFGLARWLGQDALRRLLRGRVLVALDRRFTDQGFRSVLLLRLFPGLPFQAANYGAAVSGVRFGSFIGATALGVIPVTAVYVAAAATAREPGSTGFLLSIGALGLLGLATLAQVGRAAARRRRTVTD